MDDLVAVQDGINNMSIESYWRVTVMLCIGFSWSEYLFLAL